MRAALALLIIATLLLALIRLVRWRLGHFDAPEDDARQIAECEAVHLPFGATPEALTITNEGE